VLMKNISSRMLGLFFIVALAFQVTWYSMLWVGILTQPYLLKTADFSIIYTAGRIAASGRYDLIYDLETQRQIQAELLGKSLQATELLPFNHPPLLVPIQAYLSTQNYFVSYQHWVYIMACFLAMAAVVISRLFHIMKWERIQISVVLISSLLFYPVFISLLKGQDSAFLLLGVALWVYGVIGGEDLWAGLGLSLALIRPQIAVVLAIPFLFRRRKVFWWFCAGGAALGLLSLAMVGLDGAQDYLRILTVSAGGQEYGLNQSAMFNFTGLALRLFPHVDPGLIHWLTWGLFAAGIVGLSVLWKVSSAIRLRHLGLAVVTSLFVAPHLHYHDLALLLLPILGFAIILVEAGILRPEKSMYLPVSFSLLLLLGDISPARFVIPYLVMAFLVVGLWFPVKLLFTSRKMA